MEENKIKALIQLLDDEDQEIYQSVYNELLKLGNNHYIFIQNQYKTVKNELTKFRLGLILQELNGLVATDKLLQWRKEGGENLLDGWALVTQYYYPMIDMLDYKKKISNWVHQIWLKTQPGMKIEQKLKIVLNFLKNNIGFNFSTSDDINLNPEYLFLNHVIDRKKGNNLSLCLLLNIIFHQLEVYTHVVSFKNYHAIRYLDHHQHLYIDVFNTDEIFKDNEVKLFLLKLNLNTNLLHYKPLSNIYLILTVLNQAKYLFEQNQNPELYQKTQELLKNIEIKF